MTKHPHYAQELHRMELIQMRTSIEMEQIKKNKKRNILMKILFAAYTPLFLIQILGIRVISLFSKSYGKTLSLKFINFFLKRYFMTRGLPFFTTNYSDIPEDVKPALIVTLRHHVLTSLFIYHVLPIPVVIPVDQELQNWKFGLLSFKLLGKIFNCIYYDDKPLAEISHNIDSMIKAGYTVVIYPSQYVQDPHDFYTLYVEKELTTLLKKPVDIYFISLQGFECITFSNGLSPQLVRINSLHKYKVYADINPLSSASLILERLANYFGYKAVEVIDA